MHAVGIRDLKAKLSEYLRLVKAGEMILVTEHGRVIAEIRTPTPAPLPPELAGFERLVREGRLSIGLPPKPGSYPATGLRSPAGTTQRLIDEDRDER